MKFETIRTALIVFIIVLAGIWIFKSFSEKSATTEASSAIKFSAANQENQTLGFKNYEEVRAFMIEEKKKPLPDTYKIPEYITSKQKMDDVYKVFAKRYPEFYGFGSTQLLDSIMSHPVRYIEMLTENKAIRRYYDPNSTY